MKGRAGSWSSPARLFLFRGLMPTKPLMHKPKFTPPRIERREDSAARGYDWTWRRFRAWFLGQAENAICAFKDHPGHRDECTHASTVVDHVTPLSQGGERLDPGNCRGVCRIAHDRITDNLKKTGRNEMPARAGAST